MFKQPRSLEAFINQFLLISLILIFVLLMGLMFLLSASYLLIITSFAFIVLPYLLLGHYFKQSIFTPLMSFSASLEAIRNEDYSLRPHPRFSAGSIKMLSDEISLMANDLKARKLHYDQQAVLVLNLIDQLDTPMAVFDQAGRLNHANDAFSTWCNKPWRQERKSKAEQLGLTFYQNTNTQESAPTWSIIDAHRANQWLLRYSTFSMLGQEFQLIVLTNIEKVINEAEQLAWHKMTRVLSHEINNSLSPIKSLAHSLIDVFDTAKTDQSVVEALEVIASRSDSLMQFVNRSASLNQRFDIKKENVNVSALFEKIAALFSHPITISNCHFNISSDPVLFEQVMINLLKNAIEASPAQSPITITGKRFKNTVEFYVCDNGTGIANPDNLFVPFYTTKEEGKGIGLALSRNMIEQLGGRLTLSNNSMGQGAVATISFEN